MKMHRFFAVLMLLLTAALAAGVPDPGVAEAGRKMAAQLTASEKAFMAGILKADMRGSRAAMLQDMPAIRQVHAKMAGKRGNFSGHSACDAVLLFNWSRADELSAVLNGKIGQEQVDFTVKLAKSAGADSALLARNCIAADLQIPSRYTLNNLKCQIPLEELGEQADELLKEQIPVSRAQIAQKFKEKLAKAKKDKEAKKQSARDRRLRGRRSEQKEEKAAEDAPPEGAPKAKPKGKDGKPDVMLAALPEYNREICNSSQNMNRDARLAENFRRDLCEYARILSSIAKGVSEVRAKFPDAKLDVQKR